jgi:hypothetical protein
MTMVTFIRAPKSGQKREPEAPGDEASGEDKTT